jgi:hypothetical protein
MLVSYDRAANSRWRKHHATNNRLPPDVKGMTPEPANGKGKKKGPQAAELVASEK